MNTSAFKQHPYDMAKGPSPLVPLLMVVGLGLFLRGNLSLLTPSLPAVTEGENAIFTCLMFIPILVLLAIYSASHTIVLPLAFILITYTVTTMLLGPLVLILIVYLSGAYLASVKCNEEELGWACLIVFGFFLLHWVLSEDGRGTGTLVLAIMIFLCYHFFP